MSTRLFRKNLFCSVIVLFWVLVFGQSAWGWDDWAWHRHCYVALVRFEVYMWILIKITTLVLIIHGQNFDNGGSSSCYPWGSIKLTVEKS